MKKIIAKILNWIFNSNTKHPYLEDIGCSSYPANHFGGINSYKTFADLRNLFYQRRKARKTKVDPRECFDLESSFFMWLYEHLCQLLNDTICNLDDRKYEHDGKTYTEGEYIKYLKDLCRQIIVFDDFEGCPELDWEFIVNEDNTKSLKWISSQEDLKKFREQEKLNFEKLERLEKEALDVFYELFHALGW